MPDSPVTLPDSHVRSVAEAASNLMQARLAAEVFLHNESETTKNPAHPLHDQFVHVWIPAIVEASGKGMGGNSVHLKITDEVIAGAPDNLSPKDKVHHMVAQLLSGSGFSFSIGVWETSAEKLPETLVVFLSWR